MSEDGAIGAVVLAAGTSRRYGSPKQLVQVRGRTLPEHAVLAALDAHLAPIVVVAPPWLSRPDALDGVQLSWVRNPFPERGISLSLRLGLQAVGHVAAAIILLGDQAPVEPATITALVAARGPRPIVAAAAGGVIAPPVLVERAGFRLAAELSGDVGLRELLRTTPSLVTAVPVPFHPPDLDLPTDLERVADAVHDRDGRQ